MDVAIESTADPLYQGHRPAHRARARQIGFADQTGRIRSIDDTEHLRDHVGPRRKKKPNQNAYVERFKRAVRLEWLDEHLFGSIDHAQRTATDWLWRYSTEPPNIANGGIIPIRKLALAA